MVLMMACRSFDRSPGRQRKLMRRSRSGIRAIADHAFVGLSLRHFVGKVETALYFADLMQENLL
jgi:hypothetical protein